MAVLPLCTVSDSDATHLFDLESLQLLVGGGPKARESGTLGLRTTVLVDEPRRIRMLKYEETNSDARFAKGWGCGIVVPPWIAVLAYDMVVKGSTRNFLCKCNHRDWSTVHHPNLKACSVIPLSSEVKPQIVQDTLLLSYEHPGPSLIVCSWMLNCWPSSKAPLDQSAPALRLKEN
ncbi:hypothetical protein NC652_037219 [Populus alba x Populus x berolinensis]|nr:hypothetical protein NC652_037219 [Populus alba x Populus x berolinensis]